MLVLAHSGGAAGDIYEYFRHGNLPTNTLEPLHNEADGGRDYKLRAEYCSKFAAELPAIRELGEKCVGLYNHQLLTFFGADDLEAEKHALAAAAESGAPLSAAASASAQTGFERFLLEAILSNVPEAVDALTHAVSWGDPGIVRTQLEQIVQRTDVDLHPTTLTQLLHDALVQYGRERTQRALECVQTLLEFGASPRDFGVVEGCDFDRLCDPLLFVFPLPLRDIARLLIAKDSRTVLTTLRRRRLAKFKEIGPALLTLASSITSIGRDSSRLGNTNSTREGDTAAANGDRDTRAAGDESTRETSYEESEADRPSARALRGSFSFIGGRSKRIEAGHKDSSNVGRRKAHRMRGVVMVVENDDTLGGPSTADLSADEDHHTSNTFGLFLLEHLLEQSNYKAHLRARTSLGLVDVTWVDLMMWAVLAGHFELSRRLWLQSQYPLRAAIMARRVCLRLKSVLPSANGVALQTASDDFENWAVGMLDQIEKADEALDHLTLVTSRKVDGDNKAAEKRGVQHLLWRNEQTEQVAMWTESVLDDAAKDTHPCRRVLSHRHTAFVLDQYFHGNYRGSQAAIEEGRYRHLNLLMIWVDSLIHLLNLPFKGVIPPIMKLKTPGPPNRPAYPELFCPEDNNQELNDDDELDEDYNKEEGGEYGLEWGSVHKGRKPFSYEMWFAYWSIPKVKFAAHAFCNLASLSVLIVWLCLPRSIVYRQIAFWLEIIFYAFYIGRIIEEYGQMRSQGIYNYISQWLNVVDLFAIFANSGGLVMHLAVNMQWTYLRLLCADTDGRVEETMPSIYSYYIMPCNVSQIDHQTFAKFEQGYGYLMHFDRSRYDWQVVGMCALMMRNLEIFNGVSASVSEAVLIITEMITDAVPVLMLMAFVAFISGVAMYAGHVENEVYRGIGDAIYAQLCIMNVSQCVPPTPEPESPGEMLKPMWYPLWATISEIGEVVGQMYDHEQDVRARHHVDRPGLRSVGYEPFVWTPILLWMTTFMLTVFLTNLMIAKMTSSYDRIRNDSLSYLAHLRVGLIADFKDDRGPAPPFNIAAFLMSLCKMSLCNTTTPVTKGYYATMGRCAAVRLIAKERQLMHKFHAADALRRQQMMESRVADLQARAADGEAAALAQTHLQRDVAELKEQQALILQRLEELRRPEGETPRTSGSACPPTGRRFGRSVPQVKRSAVNLLPPPPIAPPVRAETSLEQLTSVSGVDSSPEPLIEAAPSPAAPMSAGAATSRAPESKPPTPARAPAPEGERDSTDEGRPLRGSVQLRRIPYAAKSPTWTMEGETRHGTDVAPLSSSSRLAPIEISSAASGSDAADVFELSVVDDPVEETLAIPTNQAVGPRASVPASLPYMINTAASVTMDDEVVE